MIAEHSVTTSIGACGCCASDCFTASVQFTFASRADGGQIGTDYVLAISSIVLTIVDEEGNQVYTKTTANSPSDWDEEAKTVGVYTFTKVFPNASDGSSSGRIEIFGFRYDYTYRDGNGVNHTVYFRNCSRDGTSPPFQMYGESAIPDGYIGKLLPISSDAETFRSCRSAKCDGEE